MMQKIKKIFNRKFNIKFKIKDERGAIAIIVALAFTAIMGILAYVIDTGVLYEHRRDLQSIADSAALAGVQELPENPTRAIQKAIEYANLNNLNINESDITISSTYVNNDTITVRAKRESVTLFFAGFSGKNTAEVGAKATAIIGSPSEVSGIVPWGFTNKDYIPGVEYTLKYGSPPEPGPGNFGALAIDGNGASVYRKTIINGSKKALSIGMWLDPQTGNMSGPTNQGINDRIYNQQNYKLDSFGELTEFNGSAYKLIKEDSQFIIVPWVTSFGNGNQPVQILGFLQFIITYAQGSVVKGTFIDKAILQNDSEIRGVDDSGLRVIRLVKWSLIDL